MKKIWAYIKYYFLRGYIPFFMTLLGFITSLLLDYSVEDTKVFHYAALDHWGNAFKPKKTQIKKVLPSQPVHKIQSQEKKTQVAFILTHAESLDASQWPPHVALAFYTPTPLMPTATEKGHECLIMVPFEPMSYPKDDPGYKTLLTGMSDNKERLKSHLSHGKGIVGIVTFMGSRFMACRQEVTPIVRELKKQNLYFIDLKSTFRSVLMNVCKKESASCAVATHELDAIETTEAIDKAFDDLLKNNKHPRIGFAKATPYIVQKIKALKEKFHSSVEIVPLSAILKVT